MPNLNCSCAVTQPTLSVPLASLLSGHMWCSETAFRVLPQGNNSETCIPLLISKGVYHSTGYNSKQLETNAGNGALNGLNTVVTKDDVILEIYWHERMFIFCLRTHMLGHVPRRDC